MADSGLRKIGDIPKREKTRNITVIPANEKPQKLPTIRGLDYLNIVGFTPIFELPFEDKKFLRSIHKILTAYVIFFSMGYTPIATVYRLVQTFRYEIGTFLTIFEAALNVFGGMLKVICILFGISRLHKANALFEKLDDRCKDSDEVEEQLQGVHIARRISMIFITTYSVYFLSAFMEGLINAQPPFGVYLFGVDWQHSPIEFYLTVCMDAIASYPVLAQNVFNDCYPAAYLALLDAHMRILLLRVSKLGKSQDSTAKETSEALKVCIQDYQKILEIRKLIAPLISKTISLQYIIMVIICSSSLVHILLVSSNNAETVKSTVYMLGVCLQVLPTCYFSSLLQKDSNRMSTEIFGSEWFHQSHEYREMILNFIHYAQTSIRFTAGTIFDISLQMFISLAKLSFSLYTCMKTVDLKTKMGF